jgi:hypothetical protein
MSRLVQRKERRLLVGVAPNGNEEDMDLLKNAIIVLDWYYKQAR